MKQQVYHSSTKGYIPLSFTGRRLLANLRDATASYVKGAIERGGLSWASDIYRPVSECRGEIAIYMSKMENELNRLKAELENEINDFIVLQVETKESKIQNTKHIHLPPIPEGYEVVIWGDLVSISPIEKK